MFSCYVYLIKSTKYLGIDLIEGKWCDNVEMAQMQMLLF